MESMSAYMATKIEKQNREKEISERLVARLKTGITLEKALDGLSVQELIAVWQSAKKELEDGKTSAEAAKNMKKGIRMIEKLVPARLEKLENIYVLFDEFRHMPYYMTNGYICIFSEKNYAQQACDILGKSQRIARLRAIENRHIKTFYEQAFSLYGAKGAMIDMWQNCLAFPPERLSDIENHGFYMPKNPDLVRAVSMLQQEDAYDGYYDEKEKFIKSLRLQAIHYLKTAEFILPEKHRGRKIDYPEVVKPGTKSPLAVPVFTDVAQYGIFYSGNAFKRRIVTITDLEKISPQLFTINPGTLWFPLDKETIRKIKEHIK